MASFNKIAKKQKKSDTAWYDMYDVTCEGATSHVRLCVREAGQATPGYWNETLRRSEHLAKRKAKITAGLVESLQQQDLVLFPKYIVVGWENVFDDNGNPVPFSEEDCKKFVVGIGIDEFKKLSDFCGDFTNFRDAIDAAGVAGNSQSA